MFYIRYFNYNPLPDITEMGTYFTQVFIYKVSRRTLEKGCGKIIYMKFSYIDLQSVQWNFSKDTLFNPNMNEFIFILFSSLIKMGNKSQPFPAPGLESPETSAAYTHQRQTWVKRRHSVSTFHSLPLILSPSHRACHPPQETLLQSHINL